MYVLLHKKFTWSDFVWVIYYIYLYTPSLRPWCVHLETLLMQYIEKHSTDFHQTSVNDTDMNASHFEIKGSKVKVTVE